MSVGFKRHYFSELAALEEKNFWFRSRNRVILWALKKYTSRPNSFLEIGCGTGFVLSGISKLFPSSKLLGGEYFEEGLAYARERVPTAKIEKMDARCIPYKSELDAIGLFDVLEHISEDEIVLQQIFTALKPSGHLFITVPQHQWLWSAVDEDACHVRRYSARELHNKVWNAGFEIVRSTSFVTTLLPAMYLSRLFQRNKCNRDVDALAELRINPVLNRIFECLLNLELGLIRCGLSLDVGGSRLLVAQKPKN